MAYTVLITGGIGSGKSEVSRYLESQGVPVYDSDSRTKRLYDGELGYRLENAFGQSLRDGSGKIDFKLLAALIFNDERSLRKLEEIVHPAVLDDFEHWTSDVLSAEDWKGYAGTEPLVCMESAIALDKPLFNGRFNKTIAVTASEEMRIRRASLRDECEPEKIKKRINCQYLDFSKADYIINNNGSLDELTSETDKVFRLIAAEQSCNKK